MSGASRMRDAVATLLAVAGAALFAWGDAQLRSMGTGRIDAPPGQSAVRLAERYEGISRLGLVVTLVGVSVGVWSYWRHARGGKALAP